MPWRSVCSVTSTQVCIRAALTCKPTNPDTSTKKMVGINGLYPLPLDDWISSIASAAAGPASTQYQLAPRS